MSLEEVLRPGSFVFEILHISTAAEAVEMWKSRRAISKGGGKRGKPVFGFPFFPGPGISTALLLFGSSGSVRQLKASKQLSFRLLHSPRRFRVAFRFGDPVQLSHC